MSSIAENNKRIAKNTLFLYFRMFLVMGVSLYTSRAVLHALGVNDYGVYNVVGGMVALFGIISGSLSASVSRFITFELGREDFDRIKMVFATSLTSQVIIGVIVFVFAECVGVWFLNHKMNISHENIYGANWVLQCSILTFVINIAMVPFMALIIAHENMKVFSVISIAEVIAKLGIVFVLFLFDENRLIYYSCLLLIMTIVINLIYLVYCYNRYYESKIRFGLDKRLLKQMSSFAGWNFIGSSSVILRFQGNNVILNLFFNTTVNAAYGLAMQLSGAVSQFANNFMVAVNPQITKYYAQNDLKPLWTLIYRSTKFSFFLVMIFTIPLLMNTEFLLSLWLGDVPEYTTAFTRLAILLSLSEVISSPLVTLQLAHGNIRNYQLVVGSMQLLNLPISYAFLMFTRNPSVPFLVALVLSQCCFFVRLIMLKQMMDLDIIYFIKKIYVKILIVGGISSFIPFLIMLIIQVTSIIELILSCLMSMIWSCITIMYLGCNYYERKLLREKVLSLFRKIY